MTATILIGWEIVWFYKLMEYVIQCACIDYVITSSADNLLALLRRSSQETEVLTKRNLVKQLLIIYSVE